MVFNSHVQISSFFRIIYLFLVALDLRCFGQAFSSCSEWGLLFVEVGRLLIIVAPLAAAEPSFQVHRLQQLQLSGLAAPQCVEFSQTRDQTFVPYIGGWILIHFVTREVLKTFSGRTLQRQLIQQLKKKKLKTQNSFLLSIRL